MKAFLFALITTTAALGADPASFHGMALFGNSHTYISHLPMFHRPHDYQAVAEVNLGQGKAVYTADAASHPSETLYTLAPEKNFVLPQVFQANGVFPATLYRGHFERGGVPIAEHVAVRVTRVHYFQKFATGAVAPAQATYFVVGAPGELFLLHQITAAPDFDQILSITGNAASGTKVRTAPGPLAAGNTVANLTVQKILYLEFDDLK